MSQGPGGMDPRITGPASLAQQQAGSQPPGIPLISDDEAERRQQEADAQRLRRRAWRRLLVISGLVAVAVLVLWLAFGVSAPGV